MVRDGNINVWLNHEVVPLFLKVDTMISNSDYHRGLDYSGNIHI